MRNNTERRGRKLAPVLCAAGAAVFLAGMLALTFCGLLDIGSEEGLAVGVLLLYGAVLLAMIAGVAAALIQRLREIDKGEEDDARKY